MSKERISVQIEAELHFPFPDNLVYRGITGNISPTGAKINRPEHHPDIPSMAVDTPLIKLFFNDSEDPCVVSLPCDLARSHRTGFGVQFLLAQMDPFMAIGDYFQHP